MRDTLLQARTLTCPVCQQAYEPSQHVIHQRLCPGRLTPTQKATE